MFVAHWTKSYPDSDEFEKDLGHVYQGEGWYRSDNNTDILFAKVDRCGWIIVRVWRTGDPRPLIREALALPEFIAKPISD